MAAVFSVLLLVLLFHVHSHRKSFRFLIHGECPRALVHSSDECFPLALVCGVKVSLRKQDSVPGPLPSLFREDRLESFTALTSPCQWKHGDVLKGQQRAVNTISSAFNATAPIIGQACSSLSVFFSLSQELIILVRLLAVFQILVSTIAYKI